eukprot:221308-Rhodomonas_salina.1
MLGWSVSLGNYQSKGGVEYCEHGATPIPIPATSPNISGRYEIDKTVISRNCKPVNFNACALSPLKDPEPGFAEMKGKRKAKAGGPAGKA